MGRDMESRVDVPAPPSPYIAPDFTRHDDEEELHCPGAYGYHVQVVLVYNKQPASPYYARVRSNIDH